MQITLRSRSRRARLTLGAVVSMLALAVSAALGISAAQAGNTLCVAADGGSGCYTSIQAAVSAAGSGDTVSVAAGTYTGDVTIATADVALVGDPGAASGHGPGSSAPSIVGAVTIKAAGVTVSGFDISNPTGFYAVAIGDPVGGGTAPDGAVVSYNRTHDVHGTSSGDGVRVITVESSSNVDVKRNVVEDSAPTNPGAASYGNTVAGIFLRSAGGAFSGTTVEDNVVRNIGQDHAASGKGVIGIWVGGSAGSATVSSLKVLRNQISGLHSSLSARGFMINHGYNGTGTTTGLDVEGNTISGLTGTTQVRGIALETKTPSATVRDNAISSLTDSDSSGTPDVTGIRFEANPDAATVSMSGNTFDGKAMSNASATVVVDPATSSLGSSGNTYPEVLSDGSYRYFGLSVFATIQSGIAGAATGGTVSVLAGTYTENVDVNRSVSIVGDAGGGTHLLPASDLPVVTLEASGASAASALLLKNLDIRTVDTGSATNGGKMTGIEVKSGTTLSHIKLDTVTVTGNNHPYPGLESGFDVAADACLNDLVVTNSTFKDLSYGLIAGAITPASPGCFDTVDINNTVFSHNSSKGMYAEKLSNAVLTNDTFTGNGNDQSLLAAWAKANAAGLDLTLKYGNYANVTLKNLTVTNNGLGAKEGAGVMIKARGTGTDASYAANPATLTGITVDGGTFTGNERGLRFGEPGFGNTGPTDVSVRKVQFSANVRQYGGSDGSTYGSLVNQSTATVDAAGNWWGSASQPSTVARATTKPWCLDSACAAQSNEASLTALSLSSGSLTPAFAGSTTSYTTSVGNGVSAVTVARTPVAGASAVVTGGQSLAVGANTVSVTVTSADGTSTRTYTVTVTRAAAASTTTTTTTTTAAATTTTTTTATTPVTVATVPVVNAPASAPAAPGSSGSVSVAVAQPTRVAGSSAPPAAPVTVGVAWAPAAFTVPVTVLVTPTMPISVATTPGTTTLGGTSPAPNAPSSTDRAPVTGGLAIGTTVVQLNVTDAAGAPVTSFAAPLVIHVSASGLGDVPAYSRDGTTWTTIPLLSGLDLPAGQEDGYFVNGDGSIDIYTRHATYFAVLKDVQAPIAPRLRARIVGGTLRLSWSGSRDNVRVAGYVVSKNGRGYRSSATTALAVPSQIGSFRVVALDTSGNKSRPSATITVVRAKGGKGAKRSFAIVR